MKKRNRIIAAMMSFGIMLSGCSASQEETGTVPEDLEFTKTMVMNVEMELPPLVPVSYGDDDYEDDGDATVLNSESAFISMVYLNTDLAVYRTDFEDDMTGYEKGVYTSAENMLSAVSDDLIEGERIKDVTIDGHDAFCYYARIPDPDDKNSDLQTYNYLVLIGRHVYNFYFETSLPQSEVENLKALVERIVSSIRILPVDDSSETEETEAKS